MATVGKTPENPAAKALGEFYDEVGEQIMLELLSVTVLNYTAAKASASKKKIDGMIKRLNVAAVRQSKIFVRDAYNKAKKIAITSLEVLGRDKEGPDSIHTKAIDDNVKRTSKVYVEANRSIKVFVNRYFFLLSKAAGGLMKLQEFGNLDAEDEAILLRRIKNAVKGAKSRQAVAPQIFDFFQRRVGEQSFIEINGRHYKLKPYSKLVARTEMRNTQSDGVVKSCNQYDNDLVEVSNHGTQTPICEPYEGNVYSLSGKHKTYPYLDTTPAFHPNCQHFLIPTSDEAIAFGGG
jgi:hypothetical protein